MSSWRHVRMEHEEAVKSFQERSTKWLDEQVVESLEQIGRLRGDRSVILYASSFLQRPSTNANIIQAEDLNGFMECLYGMDFDQGLTLVIHTPGGDPNAAEAIVNYLRSKFDDIEAIVPTYAMSAGTMISLGTDRIVLGRQSQLGPIDPQIITPHGVVSAKAIVDRFEDARKDILANPALADLWTPILASIGIPFVEAQNILSYAERMVAQWLDRWMLQHQQMGNQIAKYFSDSGQHGSHGRRIDREHARNVGLVIEDLEDSQELQDAVLRAYHLMTLIFEISHMEKIMRSSHGGGWVKSVIPSGVQDQAPISSIG